MLTTNEGHSEYIVTLASLIWTGANAEIGVKKNYIILITYVVVDDPRIWGSPTASLNSVSKHGNRKPST